MLWLILAAIVVIALVAVVLGDLRRRGRTGSSGLVSDPHLHDPRMGGDEHPLGQLGGQRWVPMSQDDGHPRDERH